MSHIIHTKLGEGRRVVIPAELCEDLGLSPGDALVLESSETRIVVRPFDAVVREVQAFFADAAQPDVLLSDELIRDRRAEAARDDHE
jgi:AbrB family looped-hinge helix DNA binding protein